MEIIRDSHTYLFPEKTDGYVIGTPEEIQKVSGDLKLEDLGFDPEDPLILWYRDVSDRDDDLKIFPVTKGEKVYKIKSKPDPVIDHYEIRDGKKVGIYYVAEITADGIKEN